MSKKEFKNCVERQFSNRVSIMIKGRHWSDLLQSFIYHLFTTYLTRVYFVYWVLSAGLQTQARHCFCSGRAHKLVEETENPSIMENGRMKKGNRQARLVAFGMWGAIRRSLRDLLLWKSSARNNKQEKAFQDHAFEHGNFLTHSELYSSFWPKKSRMS